MALPVPPWLDLLKHRAMVRTQLAVVIEAYQMADSECCPAINPTLLCGNCPTRVMLLLHPRKLTMSLGWWEIVGCVHVRGHRDCLPAYRPHSQKRCDAARAAAGLGKLSIMDILMREPGDGS